MRCAQTEYTFRVTKDVFTCYAIHSVSLLYTVSVVQVNFQPTNEADSYKVHLLVQLVKLVFQLDVPRAVALGELVHKRLSDTVQQDAQYLHL